jgi:glycosyltransferase involved in cell wall biosynthesis
VSSLSVLVPVYNEQYLVAASLERLSILSSSPHLDRVEVIVVDDASTDDTAEVLRQVGNRLLTFLTNVVTNLNLTDMETCYKAVRTDLLKSIPLTSNDFRIEPELTIKLAKRRARIFEVPISYAGRTHAEGIVLVPHGQWNFGTLDEVLGHHRRYDRQGLRALAVECGFEVEEMLEFNRIGTIAWFLNGKLLRRRSFGLGQVLMLNVLTPLFRMIDRFLPVASLSRIAILRKTSSSALEAPAAA